MFNNQHYNDSGVSTCAICDGFFYKGQDATICGSGDAAAEEVLYLTQWMYGGTGHRKVLSGRQLGQ